LLEHDTVSACVSAANGIPQPAYEAFDNVIMMRHGVEFIEKKAVIVNIILIVLEFIAFIYDLYSFKFGLFKWYTVDCNVLQLIVSALVVIYCYHGRMIPELVTILHFVSAVGLTVTFLIAAFIWASRRGG